MTNWWICGTAQYGLSVHNDENGIIQRVGEVFYNEEEARSFLVEIRASTKAANIKKRGRPRKNPILDENDTPTEEIIERFDNGPPVEVEIDIREVFDSL